MKYRMDKHGEPISQLGYGCMRFSRKGLAIDFQKAEKELLLAFERGVNYFDTAYIYPGSEECLGKILKKNNIRKTVNIATKLPQYMVRSKEQIEKIFSEELFRLQTDYIDYYLMHMFTDFSEWEKLLSLGIEDWIQEKKSLGIIRNIGFSYHGDTETFLRILHAYDWDFCQIQYNYMDDKSQAGRIGLLEAEKENIPVIIMEPLRGGKLSNVPEKAKKLMKENVRGYSPSEWAFRWLWNQTGVTCVLSGMNSEEMVEENTHAAALAEAGEFSNEDLILIDKVKNIIREKERVGCTGCRYCMPCPHGVDIAGNFYYYNLMYMENKFAGRKGFIQNMGLKMKPGFASQCVGCGMCEKHCPQQIQIREKLKEADRALRPGLLGVGINAARKLLIENRI